MATAACCLLAANENVKLKTRAGVWTKITLDLTCQDQLVSCITVIVETSSIYPAEVDLLVLMLYVSQLAGLMFSEHCNIFIDTSRFIST